MSNALLVVTVIVTSLVLSDILLVGILRLMDVADPSRVRAQLEALTSRWRTRKLAPGARTAQ